MGIFLMDLVHCECERVCMYDHLLIELVNMDWLCTWYWTGLSACILTQPKCKSRILCK